MIMAFEFGRYEKCLDKTCLSEVDVIYYYTNCNRISCTKLLEHDNASIRENFRRMYTRKYRFERNSKKMWNLLPSLHLSSYSRLEITNLAS